MLRVFFIGLIIIYTQSISAQLPTIAPVGPKALGMGGISAINADLWGVLNNPGGIADLDELGTFVSYRTIFDFAPFNTVSAGVVLPIDFGTAGLGLFRFGDELFNTQLLSFSMARKIGIIQLGVKASYLQLNIEGFGSRGVFLADIGGIASLTPQLSFGAHIYNFSQSTVSAETQERVPTLIRLALAYEPSEDFTLSVEGEKDVDLDPDIKLGLQYRVIDNLYLRTGFSGLNNTHAFGGGLQLQRFVVDYAVRIDRDLGSTHNFGLSFYPSR